MRADEVLIIVPTRGRPGAVPELIKAWDDTGAEAKLLFAVDDDDPELDGYLAHDDLLLTRPNVFRHIGPRLRLAGTLNHLVAKHIQFWDHKAVGFMGDDHRPRTKGWDQRFAECLSGGAGVVYGNDLLVGDRFPTAVVMTSDIPATLGYFCPPGFVHLCLDLVWKDWGEGMGRITYLDDVIIEHMHPANGKAKMDHRYEEVNSTEMVSADTEAYLNYRDNGWLATDIERLKTLP